MFKFFKSRRTRMPEAISPNLLFAIPVRVERSDASGVPEWVGGAFVVCYAAAPDHLEAARRAVAKLAGQGLKFVDMAGEIQQLDPSR